LLEKTSQASALALIGGCSRSPEDELFQPTARIEHITDPRWFPAGNIHMLSDGTPILRSAKDSMGIFRSMRVVDGEVSVSEREGTYSLVRYKGQLIAPTAEHVVEKTGSCNDRRQDIGLIMNPRRFYDNSNLMDLLSDPLEDLIPREVDMTISNYELDQKEVVAYGTRRGSLYKISGIARFLPFMKRLDMGISWFMEEGGAITTDLFHIVLPEKLNLRGFSGGPVYYNNKLVGVLKLGIGINDSTPLIFSTPEDLRRSLDRCVGPRPAPRRVF